METGLEPMPILPKARVPRREKDKGKALKAKVKDLVSHAGVRIWQKTARRKPEYRLRQGLGLNALTKEA